jgi:hypothetical protein
MRIKWHRKLKLDLQPCPVCAVFASCRQFARYLSLGNGVPDGAQDK